MVNVGKVEVYIKVKKLHYPPPPPPSPQIFISHIYYFISYVINECFLRG